MPTSDNSPTCQSTVAILLAATEFSAHSDFATRNTQNAAFGVSIAAMRSYLSQLGVPDDQVLELTNLSAGPHDQLALMSEFIRSCCKRADAENRDLRDLLFYFVGHGGGKQKDYFLYLASSHPDHLRTTTLGVQELVSEINRSLRRVSSDFDLHIRQYYIFDACYSGQAYHAASAISSGMKVRRRQKHPSRGISLLCSSNADEQSLTPVTNDSTLFTKTMLELLTAHDEDTRKILPSYDDALSFQKLASLLVRRLESEWDNENISPPLPQVYSPVTIEGDLQHVPFFPNPLRHRISHSPVLRRRSMGRLGKFRRMIRKKILLLVCCAVACMSVVGYMMIQSNLKIEYVEAPSPDPVEYLPPEEIVLQPPLLEPSDVQLIVKNKTSKPIEVLMINGWRYYTKSDNPLDSPSYRFYCELEAETGCFERQFGLGTGWYVFYIRRIDSLRWFPYRIGERVKGAKNIFGSRFTVLEILESPADDVTSPFVWVFHEAESPIEECEYDDQVGQLNEA